MCSVHGLQPSSVKARHAAVTGVACMPPEQSHLIGELLIVHFLKDGNSSREHDRWKEEPNKTEDMSIIHYYSISFRLVFLRMEISQTQRP